MAKLGFTEAYMGDVFEEALQNSTDPDFLFFNGLFREVKCQQGIADFIAPIGPKLSKEQISSLKKFSDKFTISAINIVSILNYDIPVSKDHIIETCSFAKQTIDRNLKKLVGEGFVITCENDTFLLSSNWKNPCLNLWAFELKLHNWKRALFQALQSKAYASNVTVVFPIEKEKLISKHLAWFDSHQIGVSLLDIEKKELTNLLLPEPSEPISYNHYLYTFTQLSKDIE